jgi:hypothetical protein
MYKIILYNNGKRVKTIRSYQLYTNAIKKYRDLLKENKTYFPKEYLWNGTKTDYELVLTAPPKNKAMEFFRNEFATPIDKFGQPEQKEHLKKLLYPFILRRTKEQVAKDLPEKTETILFCEMENAESFVLDRCDYAVWRAFIYCWMAFDGKRFYEDKIRQALSLAVFYFINGFV